MWGEIVVAVVAGAVGAVGMWLVDRARDSRKLSAAERDRLHAAVKELLDIKDAIVRAGRENDRDAHDAHLPALVSCMRELQLRSRDEEVEEATFDVVQSAVLQSVAELSDDEHEAREQAARCSQAEDRLLRLAKA